MPDLLHKRSHLKIDRSRGSSPYKPLLLLCHLELAETGALIQETLPANPAHWPARHHLEWHRKCRFLGGWGQSRVQRPESKACQP